MAVKGKFNRAKPKCEIGILGLTPQGEAYVLRETVKMVTNREDFVTSRIKTMNPVVPNNQSHMKH